jgi:hypothetical protein
MGWPSSIVRGVFEIDQFAKLRGTSLVKELGCMRRVTILPRWSLSPDQLMRVQLDFLDVSRVRDASIHPPYHFPVVRRHSKSYYHTSEDPI